MSSSKRNDSIPIPCEYIIDEWEILPQFQGRRLNGKALHGLILMGNEANYNE